jgi:hypothetical protein
MEGLILFAVILMYAELSLCPRTRAVARVFFYTHTLGILIPMYAPTAEIGIIIAVVIYMLGCLFCADLSDTWRGRASFYILGVVCSYFYYCLMTRSFTDISVFGYNVIDYSDVIFRWCVLGALGMCSRAVDKESKLQIRDMQLAIWTVIIMWVGG